jgi:hypothetical protein
MCRAQEAREIRIQRSATPNGVLKAFARAHALAKNATVLEGRTRDLAGMSAAIHGGMDVRDGRRAMEAEWW